MRQYLIKCCVLLSFCFGGLTYSEEEKVPVPSLVELSALVGEPKDSKSLAQFVGRYNFREEFKQKNSWCVSYGVFLNASEDGVCRVGFRPEQFRPEEGLVVELPFQISIKDKIADVIQKFGKPTRTLQNPETYYEMHYDDFKVTFMRGKLFEIWILPPNLENENQK